MSKTESNGTLFRTTIEYRETDDGWEAWESDSETDIVGRGATNTAAVVDYCQKLDARDDDEQE